MISTSTGISVKSSPAIGRPHTVIALSVEPIPSSTSIDMDMNGYNANANKSAATPRYMKTFQRAFFSASLRSSIVNSGTDSSSESLDASCSTSSVMLRPSLIRT